MTFAAFNCYLLVTFFRWMTHGLCELNMEPIIDSSVDLVLSHLCENNRLMG